MPAPISDDERARIVELLHAGKGANEIAREVGRSTSTVSNVARSIGHRFGQMNVARAHEARSAYSAERRAATAARAQERADEILERMSGRYTVFNFGGRDNTYNDHELDEPPVEALRSMAQAYRDLQRTVLDIDKHDNRNEEGLAAVDAWLRDVIGGTE